MIAIYAIVAIAAFSQTVAGFGFSLVAVPLLGLVIDPKEAVALALLFLLLNSSLLAWGERAHIQWDAVRRLLLGALPGLPLGMVLLEIAPEKGLRLALAAAVFVAVAVVVGPTQLGAVAVAVDPVARDFCRSWIDRRIGVVAVDLVRVGGLARVGAGHVRRGNGDQARIAVSIAVGIQVAGLEAIAVVVDTVGHKLRGAGVGRGIRIVAVIRGGGGIGQARGGAA